MVYIADETSLHENTSWSIDGEHTAVVAVAETAAELYLAGQRLNAILIFDHSGSMKKDNVAGYSSSFEALYHCLVRDFSQSQAKSRLSSTSSQVAAEDIFGGHPHLYE